MSARTYWKTESLGDGGYSEEARTRITREEAHDRVCFGAPALVSSLCEDGLHRPAIDVDLPCRLVESRTPGHYHLYIDQPMRWWRYRLLLRALVLAGVVERGYYKASVRRRQTHLRLAPRE